MLESAIQKKISEKLKAAGWFVTKLIQTSTPGIPDLLALKDSRAVFIEVKQPGKKPTPLQVHRMEQIQKQGVEALTATSTDDVKHLFFGS
jgi:Holliday junction resolvase